MKKFECNKAPLGDICHGCTHNSDNHDTPVGVWKEASKQCTEHHCCEAYHTTVHCKPVEG